MDELSIGEYTWRRAVPGLSRDTWNDNRDLLKNLHAMPLRTGSRYDIKEAHRRAHLEHDPLQAPHGFFRALPFKRSSAAIDFVERFGPLFWPKPPELVFPDFWLKHLRYVSVVRLWEARDDEGQLRTAFADLGQNIDEIHRAEGWQRLEDAPRELAAEWFTLGIVPSCPLGGSHKSRRRYRLPWERVRRTPEEWIADTLFRDLREAAIGLFHSELNAHLFEREPFWLRRDVDNPPEPASFQLFFRSGNLWQIIWELTGLDTAEGQSWRLCPACNVLFYPKRSDQYYCRSEEQVRASKRNYARVRRQRERLNKLLAPVENSRGAQGVSKKSDSAKDEEGL
jgi:hypothetical protein